jgi:hypothetical protein
MMMAGRRRTKVQKNLKKWAAGRRAKVPKNLDDDGGGGGQRYK